MNKIYVLMAKNCDGYKAPVGAFTSKNELDHSLKYYTERKRFKGSYSFYALEFIDGVVNTQAAFGIDFT